MAEFVGTPAGQHRRFAVVASRFNQAIVERLMDGALDALVRHGVAVDDIDQIWVPGAWELPIAVRRLLASERYEGIVAVGAVIRGDTPHFDYVAGEASRGLACSRDSTRGTCAAKSRSSA
jgi:6,7-dimethyl-8-ribityllumazine synthase